MDTVTYGPLAGFLVAGRPMDRFGARIGFAVSVTIWSVAAMGHSLVRSAAGFSAARFALGIGGAAYEAFTHRSTMHTLVIAPGECLSLSLGVSRPCRAT
jgi:MFS family permease